MFPKSLQIETKPRPTGYVIIDNTGRRMAVLPGGLLQHDRLCSVFRIIPCNHKPTSKGTIAELERSRARLRAQKAIARHLRLRAKLEKLWTALTPEQLALVEKVNPKSLKIVSIYQ